MKVKTITCHDVYNVGASLQAYALAEFIRQQGHEVEILNYKPYYLRHYELSGVRNPRFDKPVLRQAYQILKFPGRLKSQFDPRKKAFDRFTSEYLPVTAEKYKNNSELAVSVPPADIYIAGSDQIWNPLFENGKDPAFFLGFVPKGKKKVSYAASFSVDELSNDDSKRMGEWLKDFDEISVREKSGVELVQHMGLNAKQVCDPVFLLNKEHWEIFFSNNQRTPYVFLYDFDRNPNLLMIAKQLAKENGCRLVSAYPVDGVDEIAFSMGPVEFLNLVFYADIVISNSFHATAFSIIFEKEFYVVNRNENINTRMSDMLSDLDLSDRLIREYPINILSLDWVKTKEKAEKIQSFSKAFLQNSLS